MSRQILKDCPEVWFYDDEAFVFSLTHQTKHSLINGKERSAILVSPDNYLIIFGGKGNWYIKLDHNCDKN